MYIAEECRDCIIDRARSIINRQDGDLQVLPLIEKEIDKELEEISWTGSKLTPAQLGSTRQRVLKEYNMHRAYDDYKKLGKTLGKQFYETYKNNLNLYDALIASVIGNGIEFDVGGKEIKVANIHDEFKYYVQQGLYPDILSKVVNEINQSENIVYVLDNVGEHYLDLLVIENLMNDHNISLIVKQDYVLNDVTIEDIDDFPSSLPVYTTGNDNVGTFYSKLPGDTRYVIDNADLIIIKGMANFETLSRHVFNCPAVFMLKAKCKPVARVCNVQKGEYVIHYQEPRTSWI